MCSRRPACCACLGAALKPPGGFAEKQPVYTPTAISNTSPQAHGFSQELIALIRERRAQNPTLGVPDVLVALELAKASLLSESGVSAARMRILAGIAAAFVVGVGMFVFFMSK
jgi:hypothetical protein